MSANSLCEWNELVEFLEKLNQTEVLEYIERYGEDYKISNLFYSRKIEQQPSIKMQVAACLAVLGEFEEAEKVHSLRWDNLGPASDKITNGILQRFLQPWPTA